MTDRNVNGI